MLLGCLAPLLLAGLCAKDNLGPVHREPAELAEILLTDLTESDPKLVPWSRAPRLPQADVPSGESH